MQGKRRLIILCSEKFRGVAQHGLERMVWDHEVAGSSPASPIKRLQIDEKGFMVERVHPEPEQSSVQGALYRILFWYRASPASPTRCRE